MHRIPDQPFWHVHEKSDPIARHSPFTQGFDAHGCIPWKSLIFYSSMPSSALFFIYAKVTKYLLVSHLDPVQRDGQMHLKPLFKFWHSPLTQGLLLHCSLSVNAF